MFASSSWPGTLAASLVLVTLAGTAPARGDWEPLTPADLVAQIDTEAIRFSMENRLFAGPGQSAAPGRPEHTMARDAIFDAFTEFGLDPRLDGPFEYQGRPHYNVVAVKPGVRTPGNLYIISGHYDTVSTTPGANDDASGCAAVMEIARALAPYPFESTLVFIAFDLEENPFIGSNYYVNRRRDDDVRGMISMDMIAHGAGTGLCDIYGSAASNPIKQALAGAVDRHSGGLTGRVLGELNRSDHVPFEAQGWQACLMIEAFGPDTDPCYHRARDHTDNEDYFHYDYLTQVTRGVCGYLVEQAKLRWIQGDINVDGFVGFDDLLLLLRSWGQCDKCPADLDNNDVVDFSDLLIVLGNWDPDDGNTRCCLPDGSCALETPARCEELGGEPGPRRTICDGSCPEPPLENDDCADALAVFEGETPFDTGDATTDGPPLPETCDKGYGLTFVNDIWYVWTPIRSGVATVGMCDSNYDTRLAVYADAQEKCTGPIIACNDDACGPNGNRSRVSFAATAGQTYVIRVGGYSGSGSGIMVIGIDP